MLTAGFNQVVELVRFSELFRRPDSPAAQPHRLLYVRPPARRTCQLIDSLYSSPITADIGYAYGYLFAACNVRAVSFPCVTGCLIRDRSLAPSLSTSFYMNRQAYRLKPLTSCITRRSAFCRLTP